MLLLLHSCTTAHFSGGHVCKTAVVLLQIAASAQNALVLFCVE